MSDYNESGELNWGDVDVDEDVNEQDLKESEDISQKNPIGRFVCTVIGVRPVEKNFSAYSCIAANLKFEINDVLEHEKPIIGEDGKTFKHPKTGEIVKKVVKVEGKERDDLNMTLQGLTLFDDINLFSPSEKPAMKKRRLFVARQIGILNDDGTQLTAKDWAKAEGRQVIIDTEWNVYTNKQGVEIKNSRIKWDGYSKTDQHEVDYGDL